jgi:hypothetical protein
MKLVLVGSVIVFLALLGGGIPSHKPVTRAGSPNSEARTPVIVELFTSEGCSSCPPADALLSQLDAQQAIAGAEVIALEEHVGYWDQLGWKDPFSSPAWTARQQAYAGAIGDGNSYTPQMVVDGRSEFVGSRERAAHQIIQDAARRTKVEVNLSPGGLIGGNRLQLTVRAGKLVENANGDTAEVWLAVTERGLHSDVSRGENAGEDLHHAPVLRSLQKIGVADAGKAPSFTGNPEVKFENSWNRENLRVVVFIQEKKNRRILGGGTARLTP